jgi:hypothetical protein
MDTIINIIVTIASVSVAVATLGFWLGKKFTEIDYRFKLIDERFKAIDERFKEIDKRFAELEKRINRRIERLSLAFTSYQEFFIEFLSREGVIRADARDLLVREARRVAKLSVANPLTKEEWEKILKYIEKNPEEFTLEEAEEFLELARKVVMEYGEYIEAWKLHILAAMTVGIVLRKYREKEEKKVEEKKS